MKLLVLGLGALCALLCIATAWLGCYLPDRWLFACFLQGAIFGGGAFACFVIAPELADSTLNSAREG